MKLFCLMSSLVLMLFVSCCNVDEKQTSQSNVSYADYIKNNNQTPHDYVINKFKDHDVVILGEAHYYKDHPIFVQEMIPLLYENEVFYLATEFARREDQPLIDSLLNGAEYDDKLAQQISFQQYIFWGYREYIDIFKAAWELNQTLPEDARKFSIIGVNDSPDWSIFRKPGDQQIDSLRMKVWRGGSEKKWAAVLRSKIYNGEKILIYCGMHHGFSEFLQPIVSGENKFLRFEDNRFGHHLYLRFGKRVFTVYLHAPWEGDDRKNYKQVRPAMGIIDDLMDELGPESYPIGFDINGTPFENIVIDNAIYKYGYDPLKLGKYCDGWIFHRPLREYETVEYITDFINESNLATAQQQSPNPNHRSRSVESFRNGSINEQISRQEKVRQLGK